MTLKPQQYEGLENAIRLSIERHLRILLKDGDSQQIERLAKLSAEEATNLIQRIIEGGIDL